MIPKSSETARPVNIPKSSHQAPPLHVCPPAPDARTYMYCGGLGGKSEIRNPKFEIVLLRNHFNGYRRPQDSDDQQSAALARRLPQLGSLRRIEGLGVRFGRNQVLRDINLTIDRGETVAIIGESGCGKTVLLKTIIALLRPTEGTVVFDGKDLARLDEKRLTAERIRYGFLFQQAALFDSMTVAENVAFPLRQHTTKSQREIRRIVLISPKASAKQD